MSHTNKFKKQKHAMRKYIKNLHTTQMFSHFVQNWHHCFFGDSFLASQTFEKGKHTPTNTICCCIVAPVKRIGYTKRWDHFWYIKQKITSFVKAEIIWPLTSTAVKHKDSLEIPLDFIVHESDYMFAEEVCHQL